jgi:hypothetical protein
MQVGEHSIYYFAMPFFYNIGLKSMTGLTTKYVVRYIKFYLKNIPEWVYFFSIEYT